MKEILEIEVVEKFNLSFDVKNTSDGVRVLNV
jgi:hypothetical protein